MKPPDENDRHVAGTLPTDPEDDAAPMLPVEAPARKAALRLVDPKSTRGLPPASDIHAEAALLGALLWAGTHAPATLDVATVLDLLETAEPMYSRPNGHVYDAILCVHKAGGHHDVVNVHSELARRHLDRAAGGIEYLDQLVASASTLSVQTIRAYAQSIRDAWLLRRLSAAGVEIDALARSGRATAAGAIEDAAARIRELAELGSSSDKTFVRVAQSMREVFRKLLGAGDDDRITTGLGGLDRIVGGLKVGQVSLFAARTSMGKSMAAAQMARSVPVLHPNTATLYVTLEMPHESFSRRMMASVARIDQEKIEDKLLSPTEYDRLMRAATELSTLHLYFADAPSQTLMSVHATATRLRAKLAREGVRLALIVIDHVGLVKPSARASLRNREQEVAETSRGLLYMAAEHRCHVLGLVQISREAEKRAKPGPPRLHDLRESGSLEQDAANVFILHRERDENGMFVPGKPAKIIVAKARDRKPGVAYFAVEPEFLHFTDWVEEPPEPP